MNHETFTPRRNEDQTPGERPFTAEGFDGKATKVIKLEDITTVEIDQKTDEIHIPVHTHHLAGRALNGVGVHHVDPRIPLPQVYPQAELGQTPTISYQQLSEVERVNGDYSRLSISGAKGLIPRNQRVELPKSPKKSGLFRR